MSPRDHLSKPLHPGPRGLEERAVAASAAYPWDASLQTPYPEDGGSWTDQGHGLDPGAPCLGGRSRRARSLGRGPADRSQEQSNRHPGRTSDALRDVGQSQQPRHGNGDQGLDSTSSQVTAGTVQVSDLGARQGNGRSQTLQSRYQYSGLLLRSTKPLAARLQRKHQRTAPTVLPERNGSVKRPPKQIECCGQTVKRTTQKNARL